MDKKHKDEIGLHIPEAVAKEISISIEPLFHPTWTLWSICFTFCSIEIQQSSIPQENPVSEVPHTVGIGFVKAGTCLCQSCYMYSSNLLHAIAKVQRCISRPLPDQTMLKTSNIVEIL